MRIRSIKPEFWRSDDIAALSISARLLFIGLWSYVDDNGVGSDKLPSIVADLFANDLVADTAETLRRVNADLTQIQNAGLIVRYEANGKPLLYVTNWEKHQLVRNPSKGNCFPLPSGEILSQAGSLRRPYADSTQTLRTGTGEQGNRGTGEQSNKTLPAPTVLVTEKQFDDAWKHWPKKVERKKSLEQFRKHAKHRGVETLTADIERFGKAYAASTEKKFVPALDVWLRNERWTDELPGGSKPSESLYEIRDGFKFRDGKPVMGGPGGMNRDQYDAWVEAQSVHR